MFTSSITPLLPLVTLITGIIVIIGFQRHSEIIAYVSLGGSYLRLLTLIMVFVGFIIFIILIMEEIVIPKARFLSSNYIESIYLDDRVANVYRDNVFISLSDNEALFVSNASDDAINGLFILDTNDDFTGFDNFQYIPTADRSDVLSGFEKIRISEKYDIDGQKIDYFPYEISEKLKPVFKDISSWSEDLRNIKTVKGFPSELKNYIAYVESEEQSPL